METQVASVVHSTYFHLRQIAQLRPYLDVEVLTILAYELVASRLDYYNVLYKRLSLGLMQKLQMVQNMAVSLLTGVKKYHHISPTTLTALH